ncbi:sugar phosphate isomerase/epimerase family protein [Limimaricola pyoseonensis]|uniref:2-keto-myo-inositol dehydratase n=1 Tax=Limimaricola pyoseonensis TaxID=521013 RepID=A0A1G7FQY0_9RHOB|nr:sugar phosphate isomerase/epimerase [Limimaricola pyoseonensis]SDE78327.1 2-keto-myo-inositol dehydratase [Limimaricola pyoseonensis]
MRLSNAPVSWGVFHAETAPLGWESYLAELAGAGYAGTELGPYGFMPEEPDRLAAALARHRLGLEGAVHVHDFLGPGGAEALCAALRRTGALLAACGASHVVVMDGGAGYRPGGPEPEAWQAILEQLRAADDSARALGLTLSVHPHLATAIERPREVRRLLDETGLSLCLDTGHHAAWGDDPAAFLEEAGDRLAYLHLKNVDPGLAADLQAGRIDPRGAMDRGIFCPLAEGAVDIPGLLQRLAGTGFAGPVVVEQDWTETATEPPAALARRNLDYLKGTLE